MRRSSASFATLVALFCVLALSCQSAEEKRRVSEETALRYAFVEKLAEREGASRALKLVSRDDLRFAEGFSELTFDPPGNLRNKALRYVGRRGHLLVRRHGDAKMHLFIAGWVNVETMGARPVFSLRLNGSIIASDVATPEGAMGADLWITPDRFEGKEWADLYVQLSSVGSFDLEPPALKMALVTDVSWSEAP